MLQFLTYQALLLSVLSDLCCPRVLRLSFACLRGILLRLGEKVGRVCEEFEDTEGSGPDLSRSSFYF